MVRPLDLRRRLARPGATLVDHAEGAHLRAHRRDRGRAHDVAARVDRRRAQLGLPLLLAARRHVHHLLADDRGLHRRGRARSATGCCARSPATRPTCRSCTGRRASAVSSEYEVRWLPGYEASSPVRVGNAAHQQYQLDVYGEVVDSLHQSRHMGIEEDPDAWAVQLAMLDFLESALAAIPTRASGRSAAAAKDFVHSKVMAWVAFDRAVQGRRGVRPRRARRPVAGVPRRDHREVCDQGFDTERNTFTQSYGSTSLDASALMIPLVGLPAADRPTRGRHGRGGAARADDRRVRAPLRVRRGHRRAAARAKGCSSPAPSGWPTTSACSGAPTRPARCSSACIGLTNDVGLLSEEYDPASGAHARQLPAGVHPRVAGEHREQPLERAPARAAPVVARDQDGARSQAVGDGPVTRRRCSPIG